MARKFNFYPGPATLPYPVLEQIQEQIVDYHGEGLSVIETSHRSPMYDAIHSETIELLRNLLGIPNNYHVLLLGGGATLQFAMVPMNLMRGKAGCDFTVSGSWAKKALSDAQKFGTVRCVYDGKENGYTTLPTSSDVVPTDGSSYLHLTSNETINGIQWSDFPNTGDVPLVADMSSDILSRPIPVEQFGILYAGAQKNIGPAGVTVVVIRDDLVHDSSDNLPAYLDYKTHVEKNSLYNTPPVFPIFAMHLVLKWLRDRGGVEEIAKVNRHKAEAVYQAIERNGEFYNSPVDNRVRSVMNVVFRLPNEELEKRFVKEAADNGMVGLKGHRSVGGCRASLYNALPLDGAQSLAGFMDTFAKKNG